MFISRITVPYFIRDEFKLIPIGDDQMSDPQKWHEFVIQGLDPRDRSQGQDGRFLFRLDKTQDGINPASILVQTHYRPKWNKRFDELVLIKEFHPKFSTGQILRFRARINACKMTEDGARILKGVISRDQAEWFSGIAAENGFSFPQEFGAQDEGMVRSIVRNLHFKSAVFNGLLRVDNEELFERAFKRGIGRGKAFGFGLLSLAK